MTKPKIAIVGRGSVATAIRQGAERAGYEVRTTSKDPKEVRDAANWGEVVILAVPAPAREAALRSLGDVKGKTLVDPTNLVNPDGSFGGDARRSGAEQLQEWAKGAHVVKAFNAVFAHLMATGKVKGEAISLLVAGDDSGAKRQVLDLGQAIGFLPIDAGPLANARYLEALGFLLIQLAYGSTKYGPDMGFRLVGAPSR